MDCIAPGSSVCGISQAIILEWVAVSFSMGSSWLRDWLYISCIGRRILYHWASWEALTVCISSVQFSHSVVSRLFATPWTAARQASLSITNSQSPPKPMSIESVMPSNHLILSSPSPPALNLSQHQGLFRSALHIMWPKYWSFSFNISPSNEHPGLISFRMDWLDLLAVQGTLQKSSPTPQFKSINSVLSFLYSSSYIRTWPLEKA